MTLMQALPPPDMATRRDIDALGQRVGRLEARFDGLEDGVRQLGTRIEVLAERIDASGDRTEARVRAELEQRLATLTQDLFVHVRILAVAMVVIVLGALSISLAT